MNLSFARYWKIASVKAVQITVDNLQDCAQICNGKVGSTGRYIIVPTLEGNETGGIGDYLMRGVDGEYYVCADNIFHKTYELAETGIYTGR